VVDSILAPYVASDGENIAVQDWPLERGQTQRGVVLLVHGLGEYAGRYCKLARRLNEWGFAVRGYDQYGHGESGGARGGLPSDDRLLDDLADLMESTRRRMDRGMPLILLGHSMGGVVAARLVSMRSAAAQALILSSPALDPGLSVIQKLQLALMLKLAPNLGVGNGLRPKWISHDPQVVADYQSDRHVHGRITARLANFIIGAGQATLAHAPHWTVPTLLMYAGSDRVVKPEGSRRFAATSPTQVVTAQCFEQMYHEIFNEPDAEPVFEALREWLDARF
jgi:alpha-beta hydrolase superfamily lysophospholipase